MFSFTVNREDSEKRLDLFLKERSRLSRKKIKALIDQGLVFVNQRKVVIASWKMEPGRVVEIRDQQELRHPAALQQFLKVVYEDKDLLVVEKEAGVLCELSPIATRPTMIEIINAYFKKKQPHLKGHYLGPVHRLDQETSGLMVYSKTKEANKITEQFKRHTIKRRYLAIVEGPVAKQEGKIEGYLQKSDLLKGGQKVKPSTAASGQKAVTHWRLLERYGTASLLEVTLNTGRTHQIRVQMASIGHPVMGDKIYGERAVSFPRQALHANLLGFRHPITGKKMEFESQLPRDLRRLVNRLRVRG